MTLLALALAAATAAPQATAAAPASAPNLLLVTIDTLRADRVGAYGWARAATPALDRLAREGVLVEDAVVHVPQTRPSHVSLLTGLLPYEHGIRDNFSPPLEKRFVTLAERLRAAGYATGGFVGAYPVSADSGLDRGFERFDDPFGSAGKRAGREERSERRGGEVTDAALGWLKGQGQRPFFAWVHLFDPHWPYEPPAPYRERFAQDPYDGEVAYADSQVARLLEWLDRSGRAARTLVVVTSDHGEGLGDHGEDEHLLFVYDTTLRVPLVLRQAGALPAGRRVKGQFRGIDLLPTLLELLGQPGPRPAGSGASRAAELRAARALPDNAAYAESLYGQLHFGWAPLRALRVEGWKYIAAPRAELYNVREDPGETRNRLEDRAQVASALQQRLSGLDRGEARAAKAALDPEASERLAALGYVGGGFFAGAVSGADPKDEIAEFQQYSRETSRAIRLFREGKYPASARLLQTLALPVPIGDGKLKERKSFNVSLYLGRSLLEMRRFGEAIGPLADAIALSPSSTPSHLYLARAQAGAGRRSDALATIARGLELSPANADMHHLKGRLLLAGGDAAGARAALEQAARLDPRNALVQVDLSGLARGHGEIPAALAAAERAIALEPRAPQGHVARGLALGALGREAEAEQAFRKALEQDADDPDALFFLAAVELRSGRGEAAATLLERLLTRAPDYPGARETLALAQRTAPAATATPPPAGGVQLRLLRAADRASAEAAAARAAAGEDFAALARELSKDPSAARGGDLGVVKLADLAEPLRSLAAGLEPGQLSPVLETPAGYVLLKREK
ncbi:MAG: sulfatase-like hydrolase/transferase [Vicinamibacteria bacterium]